ncbi:heparan-alpha-glucosaminide N-acetyltransferase [Frigidibacter sp. MR17.14]|uniref:heparan-alpha-glucosaminide N-acetyltransferase n=1 Tax=Frigidibacter sp. MR17.14 TaxID=3126509 RepID=UPI003012DCB6
MSDAGRPRLWSLDIARTVLLVAMASFHLTVDLEMAGLIGPTSMTPPWQLYARLIAGSFLFAAGFSLWLAHGRGIRARSAAIRIAQIAAGALAVSVATRLAVPGAWVFFGILHLIAVGSLLSLACLRLPFWLTALAGAAVLAAPRFVILPLLDTPWGMWTGLGWVIPRSVDFVPLFPWWGMMLLGLAKAQAVTRFGRMPVGRPAASVPRWQRWLAWPGQHGLAVYLIHQPVLFGLVQAWAALR